MPFPVEQGPAAQLRRGAVMANGGQQVPQGTPRRHMHADITRGHQREAVFFCRRLPLLQILLISAFPQQVDRQPAPSGESPPEPL